MRFLKLSTSIVVLLLSFLPSQVFADLDDFYFEDFTGDYYLSRGDDGISHLKVVENITVVFPDYEQNRGICRQIPFTNQDGANVTLSDLNRDNLKLLRNGEIEPIYSIKKGDTYFEVCTGNDNYVLGTQIYTFEYEFTKVVTDFADYQELYWDTNGNGASQKFNKVTARVHFVDDVAEAFDGNKWCYVGTYGEKGSDLCTISDIDDGWQFSTIGLDSFQNLTFDVEFKSGTFVVPEPEKNYILIWVLGILTVICGLFLIPFIKKFRRTGEKRRFYKGFFVKPEYQPNPDYTVAEMAEIYIGKKMNSKTGVLLNMIVNKQVKIMRNPDNQKRWMLVVEEWDKIDTEGQVLLKILNGGDAPEVGGLIDIKRRTATSSLADLGRKYFSSIIFRLKKDGLVTKKYSSTVRQSSLSSIIANVWVVAFFAMPVIVAIMDEIETSDLVGILVGQKFFVPVALSIVLIAFLIGLLLNHASSKYDIRTEEGLKASRYMDGLKMYIEMAEAERLKVLQSVEGADTSPDGIVHLYEKLLPYAAVFGLEESWANEMEEYYQIGNVEEPEWYRNGISMNDVLVMSNLVDRYANDAVRYSPGGGGGISGGGGFSSGSSGGGGGGFSGGGGGGGGFSGR